MSPQQQHAALDAQPLRDMSIWRFLLLRIAIGPVNEIFGRVISRAYERGFINSKQMHEIAGIWNRMVNGN